MGYGLPAGLGAATADRDRPVVVFAGDGGFLMTGQELATAVLEDLPVKVVVVDNGVYGTILMHQTRRIGRDRGHGIALSRPDFALLARGLWCRRLYRGADGGFRRGLPGGACP